VIPTPHVIGKEQCIRYGARLLDSAAGVTSYNGIPSTWINVPLTRWGPGLAVWLRPEELGTHPQGTAVNDWPDASGLGRSPVNLGPLNVPTYDVDPTPGGQGRVRFDKGEFLEWTGDLSGGRDYSVYIAGQLGDGVPDVAGGIVVYRLPINNDEYPGILPHFLHVFWASTGAALERDPEQPGRGIWSVRQRGRDIRLDWLGTPEQGEEAVLHADFCLHLGLLGNPLAPEPGYFSYVSELLLFGRRVSASEHRAIVTYLRNRYG